MRTDEAEHLAKRLARPLGTVSPYPGGRLFYASQSHGTYSASKIRKRNFSLILCPCACRHPYSLRSPLAPRPNRGRCGVCVKTAILRHERNTRLVRGFSGKPKGKTCGTDSTPAEARKRHREGLALVVCRTHRTTRSGFGFDP